MPRFSADYVKHYRQGPFPGHIDPWAEAGRYFQQIHSSMIGHFLEQLQDRLLAMGYLAAREASLQIAERRQPDVHIRETDVQPVRPDRWNYSEAAEAVMAEPGVAIEWGSPELESLSIKEVETGQLVTIVEIVSPRNKTEQETIDEYTQRRSRLIWTLGVNVVEIDPTRSVKRLLQSALVSTYPYHIAIYLPLELPRLIGMDFGDPLKRFALPLRGEVIPVETQMAYDYGYHQNSIAAQIDTDNRYTASDLPFPSSLTDDQRRESLQAVERWQQELARLRETPS